MTPFLSISSFCQTFMTNIIIIIVIIISCSTSDSTITLFWIIRPHDLSSIGSWSSSSSSLCFVNYCRVNTFAWIELVLCLLQYCSPFCPIFSACIWILIRRVLIRSSWTACVCHACHVFMTTIIIMGNRYRYPVRRTSHGNVFFSLIFVNYTLEWWSSTLELSLNSKLINSHYAASFSYTLIYFRVSLATHDHADPE